jgi:hypothetical protein
MPMAGTCNSLAVNCSIHCCRTRQGSADYQTRDTGNCAALVLQARNSGGWDGWSTAVRIVT